MARRRRRKGGTRGIFKTASSANRRGRKYVSISSSNPVSVIVPRRCAIVKSGPKKGKAKKGCKLTRNGAWCEKIRAKKLSCK